MLLEAERTLEVDSEGRLARTVPASLRCNQLMIGFEDLCFTFLVGCGPLVLGTNVCCCVCWLLAMTDADMGRMKGREERKGE